MANHVMFRSDNMAGTTQGKYLASVKVTKDIDNGLVIALGAYDKNEREVRTFATPATTTKFGDIAILGSEEVVSDAKYNTVGEFTNKAGSIARAYILEHGDCFSVTVGAFDKAPEVNDVIELQNANKMKAVKEATLSSTVIGKCVAIEQDGSTTWYVVRVDY